MLAANRVGHFWRLYDDLGQHQLATLDEQVDRPAVLKILEALWQAEVRVG